MNRIIDAKSTGKTKKLLEFASEQNAIVVCSNPYALEYKAKALGFYNLKFITYQHFLGESGDGNYVIDELEELLKIKNVIGYTMSIE